MISLSLNIRNPFSRAFVLYWSACVHPVFNTKIIELSVYRDSSLFCLNLNWSVRQSHSGMRAKIGLLGFCADFELYDRRRWNQALNGYESRE